MREVKLQDLKTKTPVELLSFAEEQEMRRQLEQEYLGYHRELRARHRHVPDPGWRSSYVEDIRELIPDPGGIYGPVAFGTSAKFPAKYQNAIFLTRHGPWNRTKKYAGVFVAWPDGNVGDYRCFIIEIMIEQ